MPSGFVIWFSGLPASGKTTLARAVQAALRQRNITAVLVDSDHMRSILTPHPTYTPEERDRFYAALGEIAIWLSREGINVLVAATGNLRRYREPVGEELDRWAEVYVNTPLAVCEARDPKGIYAAARAGDADEVPGVGAVFERPLKPLLAVDMSRETPADGAAAVLEKISTWLAPTDSMG